MRPDPSLVAAPKEGIPSGDIVSRMRAAIGLVDDLIERVDVRCCLMSCLALLSLVAVMHGCCDAAGLRDTEGGGDGLKARRAAHPRTQHRSRSWSRVEWRWWWA